MSLKKTILVGGGKTTFAKAEDDDLSYWLNLSIKERLDAVFEWNKKVWKTMTGKLPNKMEKVGGKVSRINLDQDDF